MCKCNQQLKDYLIVCLTKDYSSTIKCHMKYPVGKYGRRSQPTWMANKMRWKWQGELKQCMEYTESQDRHDGTINCHKATRGGILECIHQFHASYYSTCKLFHVINFRFLKTKYFDDEKNRIYGIFSLSYVIYPFQTLSHLTMTW